MNNYIFRGNGENFRIFYEVKEHEEGSNALFYKGLKTFWGILIGRAKRLVKFYRMLDFT